jgi:hypothetical protein
MGRRRASYTGDGSGCWTSEDDAAWIAKHVSFMEVSDCKQCKEADWCEESLISPRILQLIQSRKAGTSDESTEFRCGKGCIPSSLESSFRFQIKTEFFPACDLKRLHREFQQDLMTEISKKEPCVIAANSSSDCGEFELLSPRVLQLVDKCGKLC